MLRGGHGDRVGVVLDVVDAPLWLAKERLALVDGHANEPAPEVLVALKVMGGTYELDEDILRDVVRVCLVAQIGECEAKDGVAITLDNVADDDGFAHARLLSCCGEWDVGPHLEYVREGGNVSCRVKLLCRYGGRGGTGMRVEGAPVRGAKRRRYEDPEVVGERLDRHR